MFVGVLVLPFQWLWVKAFVEKRNEFLVYWEFNYSKKESLFYFQLNTTLGDRSYFPTLIEDHEEEFQFKFRIMSAKNIEKAFANYRL